MQEEASGDRQGKPERKNVCPGVPRLPEKGTFWLSMKDSLPKVRVSAVWKQGILGLPEGISPCSDLVHKGNFCIKNCLPKNTAYQVEQWPEPMTGISYPTRLLCPDKSAFRLWFINQPLVSFVGVSHPADFIIYTFKAEGLKTTVALPRGGSATEVHPLSTHVSEQSGRLKGLLLTRHVPTCLRCR